MTSGSARYSDYAWVGSIALTRLTKLQEPSLGRVAALELLQRETEGVSTEVDDDRNQLHAVHLPSLGKPSRFFRCHSALPLTGQVNYTIFDENVNALRGKKAPSRGLF